MGTTPWDWEKEIKRRGSEGVMVPEIRGERVKGKRRAVQWIKGVSNGRPSKGEERAVLGSRTCKAE